MYQILVILGVIGLVYFLFIKKKPLSTNKPKDKQKNETPKSNDMVECATCGTYASIDECILSNSKYYCSDECVDKA